MIDIDWSKFEKNGYVKLESAINLGLVNKAIEECISLRNNHDDSRLEFEFETKSKKQVRKIRRVFWSNEEYWLNFLEKSGIKELVMNKIGQGATLVYNAIFFKEKVFGSKIAAHQDQALWSFKYPGAINVWVSFSNSTKANGCLYGYPKSHLNPIKHAFQKNYEWHESINSKNLPKNKIDITTQPGDVVIWKRYFAHGSYENRSNDDRLGIVFVFVDNRVKDFKAIDSFNLKNNNDRLEKP